jgi:hypothetical protein
MTGKTLIQKKQEAESSSQAKQAVILHAVRKRRPWWAQRQKNFQYLSPKRIRRWRDRRDSSLIHGQLVAHRRASFAAPHKSRQHRQ